jgi:hypothetical protein
VHSANPAFGAYDLELGLVRAVFTGTKRRLGPYACPHAVRRAVLSR